MSNITKLLFKLCHHEISYASYYQIIAPIFTCTGYNILLPILFPLQLVRVLIVQLDHSVEYVRKLIQHTVNFHVPLTMADALRVQHAQKSHVLLTNAAHLVLAVKVRHGLHMHVYSSSGMFRFN